MPQSLARILVHTVFSTKGRLPLLRELSVRGEMHRVLGGTAAHPIPRCEATPA